MSEAVSMAQSTGKPAWVRGFWALMVTQFQGAFNDNALKLLIMWYLPILFAKGSGIQDAVSSVTNALFTLRLAQDATGGRTPTWFSGIIPTYGVMPPVNGMANAVTEFGFERLGGVSAGRRIQRSDPSTA